MRDTTFKPPDQTSGIRYFYPETRPKDFDIQQRTDLSEQDAKLREKLAAQTGWKQDVSNRPLSRSDLGGNPSERRA
ncbi:hypothetical protein AAC978_01915 [Desulfitobacterium sp. THU1]|uniref:hypothetical protein n=1 Tax=Desulfitobacterium sp. THU1 TaxID=3138072 RepID=UPI00311F0065